jgi:transposase-like protein
VVGKCTPEVRADIASRVEAGASLSDAARATGVHPSTAKTWITRGRKEEIGTYTEFVAEVEAARARHAEQPAPMTREEFQRRLDEAVRAGSVTAMKLWSDRDTQRKDEPVPTSKIADLAERRRRRPR